MVHRNERGRALKKVPPPLVGHPGLPRLLALVDGVAAHRRTCRQTAERLVQEAVAVPPTWWSCSPRTPSGRRRWRRPGSFPLPPGARGGRATTCCWPAATAIPRCRTRSGSCSPPPTRSGTATS
ncbi:hypothetical protein ACFQ1I_40395 [Kitasatospora arboriphila]